MIFVKAYKSFLYALHGLQSVWNEEHNFRIEIGAAIIVLLSIVLFHFSFIETLFCLIAITLVLTAEIINTAVEDLCNKIEPQFDAAIGKIKDLMAAFVLLSACGAFVIGVLTFFHHFSI